MQIKITLKKYPSYYLWILLLGVLIFLTFNRHSKSGLYNYHAEIWADKAGYYIYLPATFIYSWNANALPDSIVEKTGFGFNVDEKGKIRTKYPVGVAEMQLPFFIATHYAVKIFASQRADGFSIFYHRMIDVAGVTYGFLGLIFLYLFLTLRFNKKVSLITAFVVFLGTNAFYYAIDETGMSHIYSFFLFSAFLYYFGRLDFQNTAVKDWLVLGIIAGLIVALRPINALFFPLVIVFNKTFTIHILLKDFKKIVVALTAFLLPLLPQFIYWKYVSGHWVIDSYEGEGFNFFRPELIKFWFSTHNGLFAYTPLWFFILVGLFLYREKDKKLSMRLLLWFFAISYVFSSWWSWMYGCGYGIRPMVEFLPVFSVGFAYLTAKILRLKYLKFLFFAVTGFLIYLSINGMYHFDGCWYAGEWDYKKLWDMFTHS